MQGDPKEFLVAASAHPPIHFYPLGDDDFLRTRGWRAFPLDSVCGMWMICAWYPHGSHEPLSTQLSQAASHL